MERLKFLGYIFFALALFFFYKSIRNSMLRKKNDGKIKMTVVENQMNTMSHGIISYTPIYEYEQDGEKKKFVSRTPVMKPLDIGHEITMYYDAKKDKIVDPINSTAEVTWAIVFAAAASVIIAIT